MRHTAARCSHSLRRGRCGHLASPARQGTWQPWDQRLAALCGALAAVAVAFGRETLTAPNESYRALHG